MAAHVVIMALLKESYLFTLETGNNSIVHVVIIALLKSQVCMNTPVVTRSHSQFGGWESYLFTLEKGNNSIIPSGKELNN